MYPPGIPHTARPTRRTRPTRRSRSIVAAALLAVVATTAWSPGISRTARTTFTEPEQREAVTPPQRPSSLPQRPSLPPRRPSLPPAPRTVAAVVDAMRGVAEARYAPACRRNGIAFPPNRVMLLVFKRERRLEVWGANATGRYRLLGSHAVLAASGGPGPKRREGDAQVPEGFYTISEMNPNSRFHLSMRVSYPNSEDIGNARIPVGEMGGDIYIHGSRYSIGCVAIGDPGIEEVFTLVALAPETNRRVLIAPFDVRRNPHRPFPREEAWVHRMYGRLKEALASFPAP